MRKCQNGKRMRTYGCGCGKNYFTAYCIFQASICQVSKRFMPAQSHNICGNLPTKRVGLPAENKQARSRVFAWRLALGFNQKIVALFWQTLSIYPYNKHSSNGCLRWICNTVAFLGKLW